MVTTLLVLLLRLGRWPICSLLLQGEFEVETSKSWRYAGACLVYLERQVMRDFFHGRRRQAAGFVLLFLLAVGQLIQRGGDPQYLFWPILLIAACLILWPRRNLD